MKHRAWARAKRKKDEFASGFDGSEQNGSKQAETEPLSLGALSDVYGSYGEEVTPTKGEHAQRHDRVAMRMFLGLFSSNREPATMSHRDWDRFIRARRLGKIGRSDKHVFGRMVEYGLRFLIAVLN